MENKEKINKLKEKINKGKRVNSIELEEIIETETEKFKE